MSDQQGPWSSPPWPPQGQTNQSGYPNPYTGQTNQPTYPGQYQGGQQYPNTDYAQQSGTGYPPPPSPYGQTSYPTPNPYEQPQYGQVTYPSPPPVYPPSMQPPRKKNTGLWIALGVVAAIVILPLVFCVGPATLGFLSAASTNPTATPGTTIQNQQAPTNSDVTVTPSSNQSGGHHKVGELITANNEWEVTVNSAKFSQTGTSDIDKPADGKVYLIIDISLKNISSQEQNVSSLLDFKLRDKDGQSYTESLFAHAPDGKVEAGGPIKGQLEYEVSPSTHQFTFYFDPDFTSTTGQVIWDITV